MELTHAISLALEGKAVLFTGAGFSYGAENENGESLADSQELSRRMIQEIGYDASTPIPLSQASKSYEKQKGSQKQLVNYLKKQLCAVGVAPWHDTLCSVPWYKVYTTNFDNVYEYACDDRKREMDKEIRKCHQTKKAMTDEAYRQKLADLQKKRGQYDISPVTTDTDPINLPANCIVHLNGYLWAQEVYATHNALRLSDESYLRNELPADWQEHFISSLRAAKAVFFVGYSGQGDYVIQKALTTITNLKAKAFFITKEGENQPLVDTLDDYGTVCQIGVQKFAEEIKAAKKHHITVDSSESYLSFEPLSYDLNKRVARYHASEMITNLHREGTFRNELLERDHDGNYSLLLMRHKVENAKRDILHNKNTSVHIFRSGLGNGKTIAMKLLIHELLLDGVKVYQYTRETDALKKEIESICRTRDKTVIFFENFYTESNLIKTFCMEEDSNVALVSTARTAVYENSLSSLNDWTRGMFSYDYDVERIGSKNEEVDTLIRIFDNNALWGDAKVHTYQDKRAFIKDCHYQFKNVVIKTLNSSDIVERYSDVLEQIERKQTYYRLSLFCLVKALLAIDLSIDETLDLFKDDLQGSLAFKRDEHVREFLDFDNFTYKLDSSIVTLKLFQQHPSLFESAVDVLAHVIQKSDRLARVNSKFFELQKSLVNFHHIHSSFQGLDINKILLYYDQIRSTDFCVDNFMFWMQYALAYTYDHNYKEAQRLIDNSYRLIDEDKKHDAFQVDTLQAECWLDELDYKLSKAGDKAAYVEENGDAIVDRWTEAHSLLLVRESTNSVDDLSKRYGAASRFYRRLYGKLSPVAGAEMHARVVALLREMYHNIKGHNIESFDRNGEIAKFQEYLLEICS